MTLYAVLSTHTRRREGGRATHLGNDERMTLCGVHRRIVPSFHSQGSQVDDLEEYARHDPDGELCKTCLRVARTLTSPKG